MYENDFCQMLSFFSRGQWVRTMRMISSSEVWRFFPSRVDNPRLSTELVSCLCMPNKRTWQLTRWNQEWSNKKIQTQILTGIFHNTINLNWSIQTVNFISWPKCVAITNQMCWWLSNEVVLGVRELMASPLGRWTWKRQARVDRGPRQRAASPQVRYVGFGAKHRRQLLLVVVNVALHDVHTVA